MLHTIHGFMCRICFNLSRLRPNWNTTNFALLLPSVRLALVWRSSGVEIHSGKTLTFLNTQKMCVEVDVHNKWITHWPKFFIFLCAGRAWWYVWLSFYARTSLRLWFFCFFQTAATGNRTSNSSVKGPLWWMFL